MPELTKKDIGSIFEENVKDFLNYIGFKDVCGGNDFKPGGRQVDAVGGWEDTLFIIECKSRSEQEQVSLLQIIDSFRGRSYEIKTGLRDMNNYSYEGKTYNFSKYKKYIFVIATNNIIVSKTDQQHANKEGEPSIYLWYEIFFDYYKELKDILGDFAIYQLLGEMRVEPRENDILSVPALRYEVNGITLYHFAIEPKKLLPYVCVARRESGNEDYYQRMLDGNRLTDIRSYLGLEVSTKSVTSKKPKLFPNNVILAFFSEHQFFTPDFKDVTEDIFEQNKKQISNNFIKDADIGILTFPKKYRVCWVIDGQHRLFSFAKVSSLFLDKASHQKILVSAFEKLDMADQRKFFLDINQEQKAVHPDLIWDIIGSAEPHTPDGIIANTIKKLDLLEPFYRRIHVPSRGIRHRGQFSLNSFCGAIEKTKLTEKYTKNHKKIEIPNLFFAQNSETISNKLSKSLSTYFLFLDEYFDKGQFSGFFTTEIGWITIAIYLYERFISISTKIPDEEILKKYFEPLMIHLVQKHSDPEAFSNLRSMSSGEANKDKVVKEFLLAIKNAIKDPKFTWADLEQPEDADLIDEFIDLEVKLRKVVKLILEALDRKWYENKIYLTEDAFKKIKPKLIKDQQRDTNIKDEDIWDYLDLGLILTILEKHKDKFEVVFKKNFPDYNLLISMIRLINNIRGPEIHGREIRADNKTDIDMVRLQLPRIRESIIEFISENKK